MGVIGKIINGEFIQIAGGNIWKPNTKDSEGYVDSGEGQINKVWGTDEEGNPSWIDINRTNIEDLENSFVSKSGGSIDGTLKVETLVLGTTPSEEDGAIWIE